MTSMHFYAWKKGLKTGMYYLRTRPAVDAIKFTIKQPNAVAAVATPVPAANPAVSLADQEAMMCSLDNPEACVSCGS